MMNYMKYFFSCAREFDTLMSSSYISFTSLSS